jgi:arabinofuranosyltransferase
VAWFSDSKVLWFYGSMLRHLRSPRWQQIVIVLSLAVPLAAFAWAAWSRRWMSDDGYIYLRVVDQVLAGHGPVFNHGERVEIATSPLWVGLLALTKSVLRPVSVPWLAVVLGLLLSLAGLALAQWGAYRLWQRGRRRIILPLGAIVIAALPPFWDFATSGLETGLAFAWLGACFWGLVRLYRSFGGEDRPNPHAVATPGHLPRWLPALIGLGPLVRPDFAIFSLAFMAIFFVLCRPLTWRDRLQAGVFALALPAAYQLFRMGYYGALVPNPAFAKEASAANWPQGWRYLLDTMNPYWLLVPLLLIFGLALPSWPPARRASGQPGQIDRPMLIALMVAAALAHGVYVVYVGGDFMHARLLLPALFTMLLPVAVIGVDTAPGFLAVAAVAVWALVCASVLRVPYDVIGPEGIVDEHAYYVALAQHPHPITLNDYRRYPGAALALIEREHISRGSLLLRDLELQQRHEPIALRPGVPADAVVDGASIGLFAYVFGTNVHVVDLYGLGDPIAGRLELTKRGRPGHEKLLPEAWVVARFADPAARLPSNAPGPEAVAAARAALSCDGARRLLAAVTDPMTPGRFVRNVFEAFRLHRLRIPPDPADAQHKLC